MCKEQVQSHYIPSASCAEPYRFLSVRYKARIATHEVQEDDHSRKDPFDDFFTHALTPQDLGLRNVIEVDCVFSIGYDLETILLSDKAQVESGITISWGP